MYVTFLLSVVCIAALIKIRHQEKEITLLKNRIEKLLNRDVHYRIDNYTDDTPVEQKFEFVSSDKIVIENDDEYFYKTLEQKRAAYEKIVTYGVKFKELMENGYTVSDLYRVEEYHDAAMSLFDLASAIMGTEYNGKVYLTNGRHRSAIAKEMGADVPVYLDGKYKTIGKVKDCI